LNLTFYNDQVSKLTQLLYPDMEQLNHIIRAKNFIDNNFDHPINLNQVALTAHSSKFHFIRLFRKYYGRTPHQYLIEKRVTKAKQLLQEGSSVIDACFAVGFDSVSSFSTLFKRMNGLSPDIYKRKKQFSIRHL